MNDKEKLDKIYKELDKLNYCVELAGCGCCGSPWVTLFSKDTGKEFFQIDNVYINTKTKEKELR